MHTALEVHGIETQKNFVVRHNIRLLLYLSIRSLWMPRSESDIVILLQSMKSGFPSNIIILTSVKLTGASLPTMLPTVEALCRILTSCSFDSARFAATCSSSSFFFATSSSAFSFAYEAS